MWQIVAPDNPSLSGKKKRKNPKDFSHNNDIKESKSTLKLSVGLVTNATS
jgi:hypothetical protein